MIKAQEHFKKGDRVMRTCTRCRNARKKCYAGKPKNAWRVSAQSATKAVHGVKVKLRLPEKKTQHGMHVLATDPERSEYEASRQSAPVTQKQSTRTEASLKD